MPSGRNTVIKNAKGDYIIWLDSDEALEKDFVRRQVHLMDLNPKAGIATARLGIQPNMSLMLKLDLIPYISSIPQKIGETPQNYPEPAVQLSGRQPSKRLAVLKKT